MNEFNIGDQVWFYEIYTGERGILYPNWVCLQKGLVVWLKDDEEIMHVYQDGNTDIRVILAIKNSAFHTKEDATNYFISILNGLKDSEE